MTDWSMTVEVVGDGPVSLRAAQADDVRADGARADDARADGARPGAGADGAAPRGATVVAPGPDAADTGDRTDRVDGVADALAALLARTGRGAPPRRLDVVVDGDADGRVFTELDEAAALAGLPAPGWVPEPVALAGHRLAARLELGDAAVVLDARGDTLTAWPVERTPLGVVVTARGPVAVTDRIDELLRAVAGPEVAGPGASRQATAVLRREVRRARRRLAVADAPADVVVSVPGGDGVLDAAVFEQAVTSALSEVMDSLAGNRRVAVEVVADGETPLARSICDLIGARAVVAASPDAAVLGAAALASGPGRRVDRPRSAGTREGTAPGPVAREVGAGRAGDAPTAVIRREPTEAPTAVIRRGTATAPA